MPKPAQSAFKTTEPQPGGDLVSVVMSNYRGAQWLPAAIQSVLAQSHQNLELLLVDDASGDESVPIIKAAMAADPRVRLIECPTNLGPAGARNLALDAAAGEWIAVIDSDDLIHPLRLVRMMAAAHALNCDAVADDMIFFGDTAEACGRTLMQSAALSAPRQLSLAEFIASDDPGAGLPPYGYLKPLIRRKALGALRYDPTLRVGEDFDLYARLLAEGLSFMLIPDATYLYRRHAASVSHRLTTDVLLPLTAAHAALEVSVAPNDPALADALRQRRNALTWALHYSQLVAAMKQGNSSAIFRLLSRHPRLVKPLWQSVKERLARRRNQQTAAERTSRTLVLIAEGDDLPSDVRATLGPDATWITVPPVSKPGEETGYKPATLAARLSDLFGRYRLDVLAVGPEGQYALGMLPNADSVRFWPVTKG